MQIGDALTLYGQELAGSIGPGDRGRSQLDEV
jgi:hypothetical protein